jgi:hypothetical protein
MRKRLRKPAILLACTATLSGCAHLGVQPWEREVLARDDMQLDANALDTTFDDHIYFSKEGTSGGRGFGGGGCGCN